MDDAEKPPRVDIRDYYASSDNINPQVPVVSIDYPVYIFYMPNLVL